MSSLIFFLYIVVLIQQYLIVILLSFFFPFFMLQLCKSMPKAKNLFNKCGAQNHFLINLSQKLKNLPSTNIFAKIIS